MTSTPASTPTPLTQLTAINLAKGLTIALLLTCAVVFGIRDVRQWLYLCLHAGYCLWWLLEQGIYPQRRQLFSDPVDWSGLVAILAIVGVFYTLPGYLAFTNSAPLSYITATVAFALYFSGTLINVAADVQKLTAKDCGAGLVRDGIWRFARHVNYFGDLLRYLSFSVVAGSPLAYLVPGAIVLLYLQRIAEKEQAMSLKYSEYGAYQQSTRCLIPFIW